MKKLNDFRVVLENILVDCKDVSTAFLNGLGLFLVVAIELTTALVQFVLNPWFLATMAFILFFAVVSCY